MKHLVIGTLLCATALGSALPVNAKTKIEPVYNVDVAFVLDTTGSMSGLIEGAKQKIWSIANDIADSQANGGQVNIRFALIGYRDRGDAYITKTFDLTNDMNGIYGHLLEFRAKGGGDRPESVNQALYESISDLQWDRAPGTLRLVFLVGDAPPHMDYQNDIPYAVTLRNARDADIIVNTVQAGRHADTSKVWHEIADLGDGEYLAIAQNGGMQQVRTPFDEQIETMQRTMNGTVLGYGASAAQAEVRSKRSMALSAPAPVASDMASFRYKTGKKNKVITGGNELVEDYEDGKVKLERLKESELPASLKGLSLDEQKQRLDGLAAKRKALNTDMEVLVKKRDAFLKAEAKKRAKDAPSDAFDIKVRDTIRKQAAAKKK
jgi:von Willebrand factor type A domain